MSKYEITDDEYHTILGGFPKGFKDILDGTQLFNPTIGWYMYVPGLECDIHLRRINRYPHCRNGRFYVQINYNVKWREMGFKNKELHGVDVYGVNKLLLRYLLDKKDIDVSAIGICMYCGHSYDEYTTDICTHCGAPVK